MSVQTNPHTLTEESEELLHEIAIEANFKEHAIEVVGGAAKGEGYCGYITVVKITDKTDKNKVINLVIKRASNSEALRNTVAIDHLFRREVYMYETVFNTFQTLECEKGLLTTPFYPKYYKAQLTKVPEILILENLKENGFKLHESGISMDDNHVKMVLALYGRFHALSFALRDQDPDKFHQIIGTMNNHCIENMMENNFIDNFIKRCVKAKKTLDPNTDQNAIMAYEKFLPTIYSFFQELQKPVAEYSVALHGDCWTNNMMFKYEDENEPSKPTKVDFIDFQVSTQGSPVLDLSYYFYTCSNKEMINNLNQYLNVYYDSFSNHLEKLGNDPKQVFPYSVFQEHWKRYSKYGLVFSLFVIHLMLTENEEVIDFADSSDSGSNVTNWFDYEIGNFAKYKERVRPIILHFVENNFL